MAGNNSHRPELVEKTLDLILEQLGTPYLDLYEVLHRFATTNR